MNIHDKVRGVLYGFAFGDALGIGTEFMTRNEIRSYYPDGLRHFSQIIRDAHRSQWKHGQWSNDTDLLLLHLDSILSNERLDVCHTARMLKEWYDNCSTDSCPLFRILMNTPGWTEYPIKITHKVWIDRRISEASNESIARSIVTGILSSPQNLDDQTRQLVLITNDDSRCVSSATVIARMMSSILFKETISPYCELENYCCSVDSRTIPLLRLAHEGSLDDLKLDDENTCQWTRKSMAAALWIVWHCDNAADAIYSLVDAGGDANTNAALAGAFFGAMHGYDAIPDEKDLLIGKEKLDDMADRIVDYLEKKRPGFPR